MAELQTGRNVLADKVSPHTVKRVNFLTGMSQKSLRNCVVVFSTLGKCFQLKADSEGNITIDKDPPCMKKTGKL